MEKKYEQKYITVEKSDYWWFEARRHFVLLALKKFNKNAKILDIGCSGGSLLKFLKKKGFKNLCGVDISKSAIKECKKKGIKAVLANAENTKLSGNQFDVIIASDILEHLKDDKKAILEWKRLLKKTGKLIIFVPAFNFLWSNHDLLNQHYRRYTLKSLKKLLKKNGFDIKIASYWNFTLFFPSFIYKLFDRITKKNGKPQIFNLPKSLNNLLSFILKTENIIIDKKIPFPFGVSALVIANKK